MIFAERLQQLMTETEISQSALAKEIGYTQRAVSKWVNEQAEPTATAIVRCAQFFGVRSDYLLGLED